MTTFGPRINSSPGSPSGTSSPSASTTRRSHTGTAGPALDAARALTDRADVDPEVRFCLAASLLERDPGAGREVGVEEQANLYSGVVESVDGVARGLAMSHHIEVNALGIFGFSFLDQNGDKVQGSKIDGMDPTFEAIADGSYPVSRPLYFYVKKAHVGTIPGISEYLAEFTSEKAWGDEGYLTDKGMIPMPKEEREKFASDAKSLTPLTLN